MLFGLKAAILVLYLLIWAIDAIPFDPPDWVADASIVHPTTLVAVPSVAPTTSVAFDHDLKPREDDTADDANDWYMTCAGDHKLSIQFCEQHLYRYYCDRNQLKHDGDQYIMCGWACECKKGHAVPGCTYINGRCYLSLTDAENDQSDQSAGNPPLAPGDNLEALSAEALRARAKNPFRDSLVQQSQVSTPDPELNALDLVEHDTEPSTHDDSNLIIPRVLTPRHNYAIVCIERDWTRQCSGGQLKYSCDANGRMSYRRMDVYCEAICGCVDIAATAKCFRNNRWITTCFAALDDGDDFGDDLDTLESTDDLSETQNDPPPASDASYTTYTSPTAGDIPMYCELNGVMDAGLTNFCSEHSYYCSLHMVDGHAKSSLHTEGETIDRCVSSCVCIGNAQRLEFENKANHVQVRSESTPDPSVPSYIRTGVSVYYCIEKTNTYEWKTDVRLIEFCQNEDFLCANDSPNGAKGFAPTRPAHADKYPRCYTYCNCVHFQLTHTYPSRSQIASDNATGDDEHTTAGDASSGVAPRATDGVDHTLSCIKDYNITAYCQRFWGYNCDGNGQVHHSELDIDCDHSCQCHRPAPRPDDDSEATTGTIGTTGTTDTAPPKGVPSQAVDQYTLNCGNSMQGPPYCSAPQRGYFCNDKMQVVRTSTTSDSGITYCNNFCTCQFKYAKPCINEFGVPWCSEWWDGSVRDSSRATLVVGKVGSVFMLPNGTMVLDKAGDGFPYWASYT